VCFSLVPRGVDSEEDKGAGACCSAQTWAVIRPQYEGCCSESCCNYPLSDDDGIYGTTLMVMRTMGIIRLMFIIIVIILIILIIININLIIPIVLITINVVP
jgi:hypothetical protein